MRNFFEMVGGSFFGSFIVMSGCFAAYLFQKRAQVVDIGWCLSFLLTAFLYFFLGEGLLVRKVVLLIALLFWFGRLLWSVGGRYRQEDPRYTEMILGWSQENILFKVAALFLLQGVLVVILSLPFILIFSNESELSSFEVVGAVVWLLGWIGEAWSDETLKNFKKRSEGVCDEGLWHFSRHPNYFFEFMMWVGIAIWAWSAPFGLFGVVSPLLMYYLLRYVSGVPFAERQSLHSKGALYEEYQKRTSEFFPWFPG